MFPEITSYTYGTMTIGRDVGRIAEDITTVRSAMDSGVWFHTCRNYSSMATYNLLGKAFAEAPGQTPKIIAKIRCYNAEILKYDIEDTCSMLGKECVEIAQLSMRAGESKKECVDDFISSGPISENFRKLKEEGKVGNAVLEVFFNTAPETLDALDHDLFDGYTFYYNVLQRECSNEVFELIREKDKPVLALRAAAGGCAVPGWYEKRKAEDPESREVKIYEEVSELIHGTGITWSDLVFGFLLEQDNVRTAIAGTGSADHLAQNIAAAGSRPVIPGELVSGIRSIHTKWMGKA